jgi:hypothetical protein
LVSMYVRQDSKLSVTKQNRYKNECISQRLISLYTQGKCGGNKETYLAVV